ncbi:MAG: hypothetical protein PVH61_30665 [Candidatus Aminicenantes bacterium]|jgi:hypothetical protein
MPEKPEWLKKLLKDIDKEDAEIVNKNLENDRVISPETWNNFCKDLYEEIINKSPNSPEEKKKYFNNICQQYCLKGPPTRIPPGVKILNRVVSATAFAKKCLAQKRYPTTDVAEIPSLDDFLLMELSEQQNMLKNYPLSISGYCAWAFFTKPQNDFKDPDPIDDSRVQDNADNLKKVLGLQCLEPEIENFVCFRYPVDKPGGKKVPLAISAGFNPCFRPSEKPNAPYGWTYDIESNEKGYPEVVHESLSAEYISYRVRFVSSARND